MTWERGWACEGFVGSVVVRKAEKEWRGLIPVENLRWKCWGCSSQVRYSYSRVFWEPWMACLNVDVGEMIGRDRVCRQ